jgi:predicted regulator of Ras-like GTPase activity (Roadblock/LC7/MglB family)
MVTIHSSDGILIIMGAGEKILLAALVDPAWDLKHMTGMLREIAEDVGGTF